MAGAEQVATALKNASLPTRYTICEKAAEVAYVGHRNALILIDIREDEAKGQRVLGRMLKDIKGWQRTLKALGDAAKKAMRGV